MATNIEIYDVVVIGAGIAGAIVARHLAETALHVAVLEAREAPGGTVDEGLGLALLGTPEPYAALQARLGEDVGREIWNLTRKNLDLLAGTLEKVGHPARPVGSLRLTEDSAEAARLQDSVKLLKQDLYAAEIEEAADLGYPAGLRTAGDLAFDPSALIAALLNHPNIVVEHQAEVQDIKARAQAGSDEEPQLTIWAHKHYLWAKGVVLAAGAHAIHLSRSLGSVVHPLRLHTVDLRHDAPLPVPLILEAGHVVAYAPQPGRWRIVGWSANQEAPGGDAVLPLLTRVYEQLCPNAPVIARRSAWVAQSRDGLPVVGMLPDLPNVYTVSGLGPWGLSWAFAAADQLMKLMIHGSTPGMLALDRLFQSA